MKKDGESSFVVEERDEVEKIPSPSFFFHVYINSVKVSLRLVCFLLQSYGDYAL